MENIQVLVRIRPQNQSEKESSEQEIWQVQNRDLITLNSSARRFSPGQRVEFLFNECFEQTKQTQDIYNSQIRRIVLSALQGINGTVFMYGQTGSGKTFTMLGKQKPLTAPAPRRNNSQRSPKIHRSDSYSHQSWDSETYERSNHFQQQEEECNKGILILALNDIFNEMKNQGDKQYCLRCSYVEIYTDQVYDLLKPQDNLNEILQINEDYNKEFYIKGAVEEIVQSIEEIMDLLKRGEVNRHYAATIMNHTSSRSHTIFRFYVRSVPTVPGPDQEITESILNFVDLAGSEKINIHDTMLKKRGSSVSSQNQIQSGSIKERQNESKHINKSLFYLTQVISLRSQGKNDLHIPYRNSPLTKILRSSLGGNSRTAIILCVNPCYSQYEQSISTLRFGMNAKKIENNVSKNVVNCDNDDVLRRIVQEYERKIKDLEKERVQDKHKSDDLLQFIKKLEAQRNFKHEPKQLILDTHSDKKRLAAGSYLHYPGVGILHVQLDDALEHSPLPKKKDDDDALNLVRKIKNLQEQVDLYNQKIKMLEGQTNYMNEKRIEIVSQKMKLEKKYNLQKKKTKKYKRLVKEYQEDKNRYKKLMMLYHGQLSVDQMIFLDNESINKTFENVKLLQENLIKVKLYKQMMQSAENGELMSQCSSIFSLEEGQLIKYPQYFFDTRQMDDEIKFWEECGTSENKKKQCSMSEEMEESIIINSNQENTEFESFQTYFHQQFQSFSFQTNELDNLNHKIQNLKQDYQQLRYSPVKILHEPQEIQCSIQSFKEPVKHLCTTEKHLDYNSAPAIQIKVQAALKPRLLNKENICEPDFGKAFKKNGSVPNTNALQIEMQDNFGKYFEDKKK